MARRPILSTLVITLAVSVGATALAQTPPQGGAAGAGMAGLPRTAEEVAPWAERFFSERDTNRDGALTENELAVPSDAGAAGMGGAMMRGMVLRSDADGDARVTLGELTAGAQRMFERMSGAGGGRAGGGAGGGMFSLPRTADAVRPWATGLFARLDSNQDGSITGAELAVLASPEVAPRGGSRLRAMIVQSDSSRDSRISVEELTAGAERMFARTDVNGDGRLADDELPQMPARPAPLAIPAPASTMPTLPDSPPAGG